MNKEAYTCDQLESINWEKLKNKTILITGATGLIGSAVIRMLDQMNHEKGLNAKIIALVRNKERGNKMLETLSEPQQVSLVLGTVEELPQLPMEIHYVIHGASQTASRSFVDRAVETLKTALEGTIKLLELANELASVSGKKQYGYLRKPLKNMVDSIVDELEKMPEVAAYYSVWNGLRDTLEGYYKNRPRQHNPLSQQKEFRAIKNAIIQEAERLRQQMEQKSSQDEKPSTEITSTEASANPTIAAENTSSATSHSARLPSEYLLNSSVRLFHQMGQIFRDNAAPPSNPMGIRIDSKRRKKLMQKRLAMGHKQDDHEQAQGYEQSL